MKLKNIAMAAIAISISAFSFSASAQDAAAILKNMDGVLFAPKDMTGNNKIILIDKNGKEEVREAYIKQKGSDERIMRFTAPASQAGISVLSLPNDVMYLYLPAFGKERRISASVKNQNFAGTDFTYDDMATKPYSDKYSAKILKTGADSYQLELIPSENSDYSKIIATVNKANYYPEKMEFYDKGNTRIKEATYSFTKVGKYWNSTEIEMYDLRKNHRTKMLMSDVKFDTGLSDDEFTVRKLIQ